MLVQPCEGEAAEGEHVVWGGNGNPVVKRAMCRPQHAAVDVAWRFLSTEIRFVEGKRGSEGPGGHEVLLGDCGDDVSYSLQL